MPEIIAFADIPTLAGRVFEGDLFKLVTEEQDLFERATWIDRVYADTDPPEFPDQIIEGFYALAMLDATQKLAFRVDTNEAYGYNYGTNHVRFVSPMFAGDSIKPTFEVTDVQRRGEGFLMTMACRFEVPGSAKPGMVAEWLVLILPRKGYELARQGDG